MVKPARKPDTAPLPPAEFSPIGDSVDIYCCGQAVPQRDPQTCPKCGRTWQLYLEIREVTA